MMKTFKRQDRNRSRIELLSKLIPDSIFRISKRGVPHLVVKSKYSVCYFGQGKFFRIFDNYATPENKKLCDIKTIKEVVDFFKHQEVKDVNNKNCS